jgi:urea transport system permease protein
VKKDFIGLKFFCPVEIKEGHLRLMSISIKRMLPLRSCIKFLVLTVMLIGFVPEANADNFENALQGLADPNRKVIKQALVDLSNLADERALPILEALRDRRLRVDENNRLIIVNEEDSQGKTVLGGNPVDISPLELRSPRINNAIRRVLMPAIAKLKLLSEKPEDRLSAVKQLLNSPESENLELLEKALRKETNEDVRERLSLAVAQIHLEGDNIQKKLDAIKEIGEYGDIRFRSTLEGMLGKNEGGSFFEPDPTIRSASAKALNSINLRKFFVNQIANFFYGLSLGSILILAALGLAITFGLMGVINMAHGEMLMLGAYTTYVVQNQFQESFPQWFDGFLLCAVPVAFTVCGLVGMILERTIIRHLYGRPLETLLATWGISLILIQTIRWLFGAQNVEVANPTYLSGGVQVFQGVVLPYNRISIIVFTSFVVALVWLLLQRTSLGMQVRAVTQNREMASCMGISTHRVDLLTFGLGSGVAGLGGVALSQIGNVGPELGQLYIVDSFMVVVLGGVGKIAGTVAGGLGLGVVNKFLEPMAGAVFGKIIILVLVIILIQKRPQGIFAHKGR